MAFPEAIPAANPAPADAAWPNHPGAKFKKYAARKVLGYLHESGLWRDDLLTLRAPPFDVGEHSLVVAYAVAAEASCFLALDWPLPANVLDLYAEHLLDINGLGLPREAYTLIGAMARHRLPVMSAMHKEAMRGKILDQDRWSPDDVVEILDYCSDDVDAGERLLLAMQAKGLIDWTALPGAAPTWRPRPTSRTTAFR